MRYEKVLVRCGQELMIADDILVTDRRWQGTAAEWTDTRYGGGIERVPACHIEPGTVTRSLAGLYEVVAHEAGAFV